MNLLFVCHQFLPEHIGGTELYTWGLAKRAYKMGWNVLVLSYMEEPSGDLDNFYLDWSAYNGLPTARIFFNLGAAKNPIQAEYYNEELIPFFKEIWERFQPDLVHFTHSMKVSSSAIHFFTRKKIPTVLTLSDFWFICPRHTLLKWDGSLCQGPKYSMYCAKCLHQTHGFLPRKIMNWSTTKTGSYLIAHRYLPQPIASPTLKQKVKTLANRNKWLRETALQTDRILVLSSFQKDILIKNGFPKDRLTLTPHGIETAHLQKTVQTPAAHLNIRLTFIGSIVPHKGLHTFLEAFGQVNRSDLTLTIYGSTDPAIAYQKHILEASAKMRNVHLGGVFPADEMGNILAQTDILIMPVEWYENEPLVIKAALYQKIPVMASDIGSLREMIQPGINGWLIPPRHQASWVKVLQAIKRENLPVFQGASYPVYSMDTYFSNILNIYNDIKHAD